MIKVFSRRVGVERGRTWKVGSREGVSREVGG